jgi:creatinine amidohydrolase
MSVLMQEMTWPEVKAAVDRDAVLILPAGAVEQHGPHLPLGTDTYLPLAVVERAAERIDCVIAPPLHYGYKSRPLSGGGQGFVGTTSLRGHTCIDITRDVVAEFLRHGFKRLAIVNWHMESSSFLYEGVDLAVRELPDCDAQILVITDAWPQFTDDEMDLLFPAGSFDGWDVEHASVVESSMMMVLFPDLVHMERALDDGPAEHPPYEIVPPPRRILTDSGVLSRATAATAEKGDFLVTRMVDHMVAMLRKEFPDLYKG